MQAKDETYGDAKEVADWLLNADYDKITRVDLISVLVNAMNKIDVLADALVAAHQRIEALEAKVIEHGSFICPGSGNKV